MLLTDETLTKVLDRLNSDGAADYQPAGSVEEAGEIASAAGRRWALELANVPELLHLRDAMRSGPNGFVADFFNGVFDVLDQVSLKERALAETAAKVAAEAKAAEKRAALEAVQQPATPEG